jgi:hypothetical protein
VFSDCFVTSLNSDISSYVNIRIDNEIDSHSKDCTKVKTINIACYSFFNREAFLNFDSVDLKFTVSRKSCNESEGLEVRVSGLSRLLIESLEPLKEKIKDHKGVSGLKDEIINRVEERFTRESLLEKADQGYRDAQYEYARMCYEGKGGSKDFFAARRFFKLAAGQDHAKSQLKYAYMCLDGLAGDQSFLIFKSYLQKAANNGNSIAQYEYALMYYKGDLVEKDFTVSRKYYKLAADQGHREAQFEYAEFYGGRGSGCCYDYDVSKKYYMLAAEQGHPKAQLECAHICVNGVGADYNLDKAKEYCRLSIAQGNLEAKKKLALLEL